MAYREQTVGALQDAQEAASELLISETVIKKRLSLPDAFVLLAASHLTQLQVEGFTISDVRQLSRLPYSSVAASLEWLCGLNVLDVAEKVYGQGRPTKIFNPTELGGRVLGFFQPSEIE